MADFPTAKTEAVDNVTDVLAKHINNLEDKVGIDSSADADSLDYRIGAVEDDLPTGDIVGTTDIQTLTNKTLTSPKLNEDVAVTITASQLNGLTTGWIPAGETWTYSSVDDPTGIIAFADADTILSLGMRIKFTNGGNTIYGIVTAVTSTTFTFLHEMETDGSGDAVNLMADSAITNPYYSTQKAPFGFPISPLSWQTYTLDTNTLSLTTIANNTEINSAYRLVVPIGLWEIGLDIGEVRFSHTTNGNIRSGLTSSSADNSTTDRELSIFARFDGTSSPQCLTVSLRKVINVASKQTRYIVGKEDAANNQVLISTGKGEGRYVLHSAVCAYL
jgi:hypothetical protein